ncbi:MAG: DUF4430 domain-containing protein [Peptostreptococcaceae bacterium]|nr:DUF4430 domain-containing protein [Peptostreptococcaceae bacterium]
MKRKIIYIILVILFAIAVTFVTNGCTSQAKEKESAVDAEQQIIEQETEQNQNGEVSSNTVDSTTAGGTSQTGADEGTAGGTVEGIEPTVKESAETGNNTPATQKKYVTITVSSLTIFDNLDTFDQAKKEILPENGLIVQPTKVEIKEGETVFDVLLKVTKDKGIHMEYVSTPLYKSNYIEGIGNIYEIDAGPLSGWMYKVNNWFPNYGCGRYVLKDGDNIEWVYTCDLGRDVGGDWNEQNK